MRGRGALLLASAAAVAALGASCRRGDDRRSAAAGAGPYAEQVADAIPRIEKGIGLTFKTPPKVETRSQDEVRQFLERMFAESQGAKDIAAKSAVYKRLGMIPDTLDLRTLFVDLLTEQIVGFYDPKTKVLYVVKGAAPEQVGLVVTHELVHALQDQYFNLDSLQNVEGDDDRVGAAQAVMEGQAVYEQLASVIGDANVAQRLPGGWDRIRQTIREQQSSMPIFAAAPLLVQESLIFPYLSGAEFMRRYKTRHPGAVPYRDMPQSTEQILHEEAYFGARRDAPLRVTLPPVAGGKSTYENDLGEFETRLFLFQHLRDQNGAIRGAAGWGGDRYALVDTPAGQGLVWVTVWDSPFEAAEFTDQLGQAVERRYETRAVASAAPGSSSGAGSKSFSAAGRRITVTAGEAGGRPAVLYMDLPAGAAATSLDLSKVDVQR